MDLRHIAKTLKERSIKYPNGCRIWRGIPGRYAQMSVDGKAIAVHRAAYIVAYGAIPKRMHICHRCDTPGCVNPKHLFLGSPKDNAQDRVMKIANGVLPPNQKLPPVMRTKSLMSAIESAGSVSALAKKVGVSRQAVSRWTRVPTGQIWSVSQATGIPIERFIPRPKNGAKR